MEFIITIIPITIKIATDITFRWNFGTFRAISAPKNTPIQARLIKARNEPIHTSNGRLYVEANVIVKIWVLSPNSIKEMNPNPAR